MSEIWTPPPFTLAAAPIFTAPELDRFEREILTNPRATERHAARLFCDLPKFLYLGQGAEIRREVVLYRADGTPSQRVDFFRRSYGRRFWDIIEIKSPNRPFIASERGLHPRVSADVETAISQALDYREFINESAETRAQLLRRGLLVCRPQIVVIVGKHGHSLDCDRLEALYDRIRSYGPIAVYSYEDIYEFAREHYSSNQFLVTVVNTFFHPNTIPNPDPAAQIGNADAVNLVVKGSIPYLRALIHRNVPSETESEDLVQETLLRAFKDVGTLKDVQKFRNSMTLIALHVIADFRTRKYRERVDRLSGSFMSQALPADERLLMEERKRELMAAICSLPRRQQQALFRSNNQASPGMRSARWAALRKLSS